MDQASATARAATGTGWAAFAGVFFLVAGTFQVIEGIAALSKSRYLFAQVLFANLEFWGVVLLIVGGLGIFAGYAILRARRSAACSGSRWRASASSSS